MGPIAVAPHFAPYLPSPWEGGRRQGEIRAISAAPWGSASICLSSYGYIRMLAPMA